MQNPTNERGLAVINVTDENDPQFQIDVMLIEIRALAAFASRFARNSPALARRARSFLSLRVQQ